jgi:small subunit ribosomal protein S15
MCYHSAMLTKRKKANEIVKAQRHDTDTGSPEVQVAVLTRRIAELSAHLDKNRKDKHSRRGLLGLVADRRKHLKYLETNDKRAYGTLVKKLGLKK